MTDLLQRLRDCTDPEQRELFTQSAVELSADFVFSLFPDHLAQGLDDLECRCLRGGDGNRLTDVRIATPPTSARPGGQGSESGDGHGLSLGKGFGKGSIKLT